MRRLLAALVVAIGLATSSTAQAALVPAPASPLDTGAAPWEASAADVDGDGRQDLLVTNENDGDLTVLLGTAGGGFVEEAGSPVAVGELPIATAVADFNGDGRTDVAVTNYGSDDVTILERRSDNSGFTESAASPVTVGSSPYGIVAPDIDGDGRPDLAVTNLSAVSVSILRQQNDGTFAEVPGSPVSLGGLTAGIAAADFDDDGDPDLAVAVNGTAEVAILLNTAAGYAAETGSPIAVGGQPTRLWAGDLSGDGLPDLAVANSLDDTVTLLLRDATEDGFSEAAGSPVAAGDKPYDVAAADLDLDGTRELVVSNETGGTLSILKGTPAAGYAATLGSPLGVGAGPLGLVVSDLDGNGRPDIAVADHGNDTASIYLNDPPRASGPPPPAAPPGCTPPTAGRVALWRAEGSAGDSAGAHDGTLRFGAGYGPGAVGQAFALPGDEDHVRVPDALGLNITGDLTLDAWVKLDDLNIGGPPGPTGVGGDRIIFWKVDAADRYATYALWIEGDGHTAADAPLRYNAGDRQQPGSFVDSEPLSWQRDRWYHVAATRSGDTISFYRDGRPAGSATLDQAAVATPLAPVALGALPQSGLVFNPLKGGIDEAGIWSRALSAAEVAQTNDTVTGACRVEPPPPPPPPLQRPANLTRPSIVGARSCSATLGGGCTPLPNVYRCDPGSWADRDPARPYRYAWHRMVRDTGVVGGYRRLDPAVASGETFHARATSQAGLAPALWHYQCAVEATNDAGASVAYSERRLLDPEYAPEAGPRNPTVDVRVTGIEVTQGIQQLGCTGCQGVLPSRDQASLSQPATVAYRGVDLAAGKFTIVRVFADYVPEGGGAGGALNGVTARLELYDSVGRRTATLTPDFAPPSVPRAPADNRAEVLIARRNDARASFNFLVPWQQTEHRRMSLRAVVAPATTGLAPLKQCAGCNGNVFTLEDVPFKATETVPVRPIRLRYGLTANGRTTYKVPTKTEGEMFGSAQVMMPGDVRVFPYPAQVLDVETDSDKALAAVAQWAVDSGFGADEQAIGIFVDGTSGLGGLTSEAWTLQGFGFGMRAAAIGRDSRPISSVAHEIGHLLGLPHADTVCGGNSGDQFGVASPPGNTRGSIRGLGLDRRASYAEPRVFTDGYPPTANEFVDLMSYCANHDLEGTHWIGLSNWRYLLEHNAPNRLVPASADRSRARRAGRAAPESAPAGRAAAAGPLRAAPAAGPARPLRVIATIDASGAASVFRIAPGQDARERPEPSTSYRLELRDAAGATLSSAVPAVQRLAREGAAGSTLLTGTLDFAPPARQLVVLDGDRVLATRTRTAHAPTARILAPRGGAIVGRAPTTRIAWSARDADGDRLRTTIDYSRDGGRSWKVVATDVAGRSVRLASRALPASRNARIRLRVSDGFDAAIPVSGRFRAIGAPPRVRIVGAARRTEVRSDGLLLLEGAGFDDAGRPLSGRRLRWFAGSRLLGSGEQLSARSVPVGARSIRLVATDSLGRSAVASVPLRVNAVRPELLAFEAPATVKRTAKALRLRVATTAPATLRIGGRRYATGRTPRRISVPIAGRARTVRLAYTLIAHGKATRGRVEVRRIG